MERVLGFSFEDAGSAAAQPAAPSRNTVDYAKARLAWDNARKHLRGQLASLKTAIDDQSSEEPDHDEIRANLSKLDVVLDALDERLLDKLDEVTNAEDAALRFQLAQEARGIALGYRAFVARNPLMRDLDGNPFVPLDAKARIESTLTDLLRQL